MAKKKKNTFYVDENGVTKYGSGGTGSTPTKNTFYVDKNTDKKKYGKAPTADVSYLDGQLNSYDGKLDKLGLQKDEVLDDRNFIEKGLNLRKNQNALFDVFELVGRGQQGLFGVLDALTDGDDSTDWADSGMQGLTGNKEVSGGKLMRNIGVSDEPIIGEIGMDDIIGFGLDVFLDPADLVTFGVGGTAAKVFGKSAKGASKAIDAAYDMAKVSGKVDNLASAGVKVIDDLDDIVKGASSVVDLKKGGVPDELIEHLAKSIENGAKNGSYKTIDKDVLKMVLTGKDKTTLTDATFKGLGAGIKTGFKTGDNLISKGLTALDNSKNYNTNLAGAYKDLKKSMQLTFNNTNPIVKNLAKEKATHAAQSHQALLKSQGEIGNTLSKIDDFMLSKSYDDWSKILTENKIGGEFKDEFLEAISKKDTKKLQNLFMEASSSKATANRFNTSKTGNIEDLFNVGKIGGVDNVVGDYKTLNSAKASLSKFYKKMQGVVNDPSLPPESKQFALEQLDGLVKNGIIDIKTGKVMPDLITNKNGAGVVNPKKLEAFKQALKDSEYKMTAKGGGVDKNSLAFYNYMAKQTGFSSPLLKPFNNVRDVIDGTVNKAKFNGPDNLYVRNALDKANPTLDGKKLEDLLGLKNNPNHLFNQVKTTVAMDTRTFNKQFKNLIGNDDIGMFANLGAKDLETMKQVANNGLFNTDLEKGLGDFVSNYTNHIDRNFLDYTGYEKYLKASLDDTKNAFENLQNANKVLQGASTPENIAAMEKAQRNFEKAIDNAIAVPTNMFDKAPIGMSKISKTDLINHLKKSVSDPMFESAAKKYEQTFNKLLSKDGDIYISQQVLSILGINNPNDTTNLMQPVLDIVGKVNNVFKKSKLLSLSYNIRNVIGNVTNLALAGVPTGKIFNYLVDGSKVLRDGQLGEAILKSGGILDDVLDASQKLNYDLYFYLQKMGFAMPDTGALLRDIEDLSPVINKVNHPVLGKIESGIDKINDLNKKGNEFMDTTSRFAMLLYVKDNPTYLTKMGFTEPSEAVSFALFNPNDLSTAETGVLRKIIPFYTFTKKNLAFQVKNITENATKYNKLVKGMNSAWEATGLEDEQIADYNKSAFNIPLPMLTQEDGTTPVIKANLPFSDFGEYLENPLQRIVSATTPVLRTPFELLSNTNTFTNSPISAFKGQQSKLLEHTALGNAPEFINNRYTDYALSQLGLDVPYKTAKSLFDVNTLTNQGVAPYLTNLSNMMAQNDPAKVELNNKYAELAKLQEYFKYLKEMGVDTTKDGLLGEQPAFSKNLNSISGQLDGLLYNQYQYQPEAEIYGKGKNGFYIDENGITRYGKK